ncbi:MAG: amidohydrolase family protein [Victivallales bacterium]|nr:amidohydrolase family protein [Victivallales bacterium]
MGIVEKILTLACAAGIMLQAQGIVDVHSHILPSEYIANLKKHNALMDEGFPLSQYDAEAHLKWMDEAGIRISVLTMAAPQPSFGDAAENAAVIRRVNETAAVLKREHPGRFLFCATLPQPDVKAAIAEVEYAFDVLHADGVKLATNVGGQYLGSPELDPLMEVLNKRKAIIILHPHRPEPISKNVMNQTPLAMQEYLSETTRTICNMISRNVLARYPNIKLVVPHCGAYLPLALPRMKALAPVMKANGLVGDIDFEANLRELYYDLAGAPLPDTLRSLLTITTPDRLLYGSDFPYAAPQALSAGLKRLTATLDDMPELAPFKEDILSGNALRLFGLSKTEPNVIPTYSGETLYRIAEIEVLPEYLDAYLEAARDVGAESVAKEPGVLCVFPMRMKESPNLIRILEIYKDEAAYKAHLASPHFRKYKEGTPHMIKSLRLVPMTPLDAEHSHRIFRKQ